MKIFKVNGNEYEIYLSSNGVMRIEEEMGCSLQQIDTSKVGIKSIIVLLYGVLWQRNKLPLEKVADLFDNWLENNDMAELGAIVKGEISAYSGKMKKNKSTNDDDKKK